MSGWMDGWIDRQTDELRDVRALVAHSYYMPHNEYDMIVVHHVRWAWPAREAGTM